MRFIPFLAALALLCGCGGATMPELRGVTRAEVRTNRDLLIKEVSDPEQLRQLVAFVNARRAGWGSRFDGVPVPERVVNFYEGETFKGHVGWGRYFFETQRDDRGPFSREATPEEVGDLESILIGESEWRPRP
jgi:hypothetical protein